ncbi:GH39 family glycosyl hydrolase [Granulicella sibirica]|uniref:Beta-xylosidase n=1 Tax=Granulicella sibirica TaxID=2479048 RepID=A0A4Q0T2I5_9BACT|nr:glycosyl hydrolase family 39 [Granulicella sibirica]RXH57875.1 Beta-xylosidase [Granulicella sibirica]
MRLPLLLTLFLTLTAPAQTIDATQTGTPFPHFWEQTFGSGRAILSLRESYRNDLRTVKQATDFKSIRFHGIFMDEVGIYDPDRVYVTPGQATRKDDTAAAPYNFSYVDQIYDGLLANHVQPFVELSFMPRQLASDPKALHAFWYKQNVSPPADYAKWDAMIAAFASHLIDRYGIAEVSQWNFEVWNEPNIDFWVGNPKQSTYFTFYEHTARALKQVNTSIRVGGPATAQAAWVGDFLKYCHDHNVPVDFASTHVYANDTAPDVLHTKENVPRDKMVARAVAKVHTEILASPLPKTPLIFSEYNASYANEPNVTDSIYLGSWLANNIAQCDGLTESMAYWAFSDVFEEQGVVRTPFYGGFGLLAADSIPKPALNAFAMLHRLGDTRLPSPDPSTLVTRRADGTLVIALWNYAAPIGTGAHYTSGESTGPSKSFSFDLKNLPSNAKAILYRLDENHGNVLKAYDAMGRPALLTQRQIHDLQGAGQPAPIELLPMQNGKVQLDVPPQGLYVLEIK